MRIGCIILTSLIVTSFFPSLATSQHTHESIKQREKQSNCPKRAEQSIAVGFWLPCPVVIHVYFHDETNEIVTTIEDSNLNKTYLHRGLLNLQQPHQSHSSQYSYCQRTHPNNDFFLRNFFPPMSLKCCCLSIKIAKYYICFVQLIVAIPQFLPSFNIRFYVRLFYIRIFVYVAFSVVTY